MMDFMKSCRFGRDYESTTRSLDSAEQVEGDRYVARELAWLTPDMGLFSPASSAAVSCLLPLKRAAKR